MSSHRLHAGRIGPNAITRVAEATRWLIDFARSQGTADLWAAVHPLNVRSIRLLERLGFVEQPVPPTRPLGSYDEGDVVFLLDAGLSTHGTVSVRL